METVAQQVRMARRVSMPTIVITTPDQEAALESIKKDATEAANGKNTPAPMIRWDCLKGPAGMNDEGTDALLFAITRILAMDHAVGKHGGDPPERCETCKLGFGAMGPEASSMLRVAEHLPPRTILAMMNMNAQFTDPKVIQGVANVRDLFKGNTRTLILFDVTMTLPLALTQDALVIDEALPTQEEHLTTVERESKIAAKSGVPMPSKELMEKAASALRGLARFPAESEVAMSFARHKGINIESLQARTKAYVKQQQGLSILDSEEGLDDVKGCDNAKTGLIEIFEGRNPPRCILFMDEMEKGAAAGLGGGDSNGVGKDQLGQILTAQNDKEWPGLLYEGIPGTGKSYLPRCAARTYGIPMYVLDFGGMQSKWQGESQHNIRNVIKVMDAVGGHGRVLFIGTCNDSTDIPLAWKRRLNLGWYFFDTMLPEEQAPMFAYYMKKYELDDDPSTIDTTGWTPAEIRNVCFVAWTIRGTLKQAAMRINAVAVSAPGDIAKARQRAVAAGFLSTTYPGRYRIPTATVEAGVQGERKYSM